MRISDWSSDVFSSDLAHASVYENKMHGCGHDGHMLMLLAAGRFLARHNDFAGTVYLIFQPAEEVGEGATKMMDEGLFRSEESRVGNECVSTCRSRWYPCH